MLRNVRHHAKNKFRASGPELSPRASRIICARADVLRTLARFHHHLKESVERWLRSRQVMPPGRSRRELYLVRIGFVKITENPAENFRRSSLSRTALFGNSTTSSGTAYHSEFIA